MLAKCQSQLFISRQEAVKLVPLAFIWIQGTELDLEAGSARPESQEMCGWVGWGWGFCFRLSSGVTWV